MERYDAFRGPHFRRGFGGRPPRYDRDFRPRYGRDFEPRRFGRYDRDVFPERPRSGRAPRELSDRQILDAVCDTMTEDGYIRSDGIEVTVKDGVVTLRGEVGDYLEARYAWDDAWETEGVRGVISHLTVRTEPPAGQ